jgi:hypothetical protein
MTDSAHDDFQVHVTERLCHPVVFAAFSKLSGFDPMPTHITDKESEFYGFQIQTTELGGDTFYTIGDEADAIWIGAQAYKEEHGESRYQTLQRMMSAQHTITKAESTDE